MMSGTGSLPLELGTGSPVFSKQAGAQANRKISAQPNGNARRVGVAMAPNGIANGSMNGSISSLNGTVANGKLPKLVMGSSDGSAKSVNDDQRTGSPKVGKSAQPFRQSGGVTSPKSPADDSATGSPKSIKSAVPFRRSGDGTSPKVVNDNQGSGSPRVDKSAKPLRPSVDVNSPKADVDDHRTGSPKVRSARPMRTSVAVPPSPLTSPTGDSIGKPQRLSVASGPPARPRTTRPSRVSTAVKPLPLPSDKKQRPAKSAIVRRESASVLDTASPDRHNAALLKSFLTPLMKIVPKKKKTKESKAELSSENKAMLAHVLSGSIKDIPPLNSKIVRIFLSSTFTDMREERNKLMAEAIPALKIYCRETHGLEFQVVDMRWGVRDEATDDHMTTELCMKEIANCQRLSLGPNFVAFLGNKYGYRPVPTSIPGNEFERLCGAVKGGKQESDLLRQWYRADENACPLEYLLRPISSIYSNFNNKSMPHLQKRDQDAWWGTLSSLQRILRQAAMALHDKDEMTGVELHNYLMSVTEREVCHGILEAKDTDKHCLAYVRDLDIPEDILPNAWNFVDLSGRSKDEAAQKLLETLRETKLVTKLLPTNISHFNIEWKGKEGIDATEHAQYLQAFSESFRTQIISMVDKAVEMTRSLASDPNYEEVLQHSHACAGFVKAFQGREPIIDSMNAYMTGDSREPFVVYGESGCGKTSLLAKCFSQIPEKLGKGQKPVMLLRFLGTTPDSSLIVPLLKSLSRQIRFNYNAKEEIIPDDISALCNFFKRQLYLATPEKPLYIALDSLDQLSPIDGAYEVGWMPISLPPNVKVVVSVALMENIAIYENLRKVIDTDDNFLRVYPLGEELSATIIRSWLSINKRMVSVTQWRTILQAISHCNLPLFVKLVFEEVCQWKSFTPPENAVLANDVYESIMRLFERIEKQHGFLLVSHALRYLAASKSGLSEMELEDLLSLNEEVLNDVYQYHLPPVRRIPPLLWTRIRGDLPHYITEREADGVNVIHWYHRQFIDTSRKRYFRNVNNLTETHSHMADYFLGIWGSKPKPFEYSQQQKKRFYIDEDGGESDRKVPDQPLYFVDSEGSISHYNLRKLSELPYHLSRAGRTTDLYREVLFNFRWLHAKLSCLPLSYIVEDFEDFLAHQNDREVKLVVDTLRLSASVLMQRPSMLGPHLLGRLLPYFREYSNIRSLLQQCDSDGVEVNALVPIYHCLHTPGGPLHFSLEGHTRATFSIMVTSDKHHLVSISNVLLVYDLSTGEEFRKINPNIRGMLRHLSLSPDDTHAICVSNTNQLLICSLFTGEHKLVDIKLPPNATIWGTAASKSNAFVYTECEMITFTYDGQMSNRYTWDEPDRRLVDVYIINNASRLLVYRTGVTSTSSKKDEDEDAGEALGGTDLSGTFKEIEGGMTIVAQGIEIAPLVFDGPLAMSCDRKTAYVCVLRRDKLATPPDEYSEETIWRYKPVSIECYKRCETEWMHQQTITHCDEMIFDINISHDGLYLVASTVYGYNVWNTQSGTHVIITLPDRVRNIPDKYRKTNHVLFTRDSKQLVAAVRERIFVWDVQTGKVAKILDGHFKRILRLVLLPNGNAIVSSSFDRSIKVWNFDNLMCKMNPLDRHEKVVRTLSVAERAHFAVTTTRGGIGFWNLRTGKMRSLSKSIYSSTASVAAILADGKMAITAEAGFIYVWELQKMQVLVTDEQAGVEQLLLTDKEATGGFLAFSKDANGKAKCICRKLPSGQQTFTFEYTVKKFRKAIFSGDRLYLLVPGTNATGQDVLNVYHARTGTALFDMVLDYPERKEILEIKPMPRDNTKIILVEREKCVIWDIKAKALVKSVPRWNGYHTRDGKYGLHTPNIGGLELLDLKTGKTVRHLLPRANEGIYHSRAFFMNNDDHVVYYHGQKQVVRVVRMRDLKVISEMYMGADVTCFELADHGNSLVLAGEGGGVYNYYLADPEHLVSRLRVTSLPNRTSHLNLHRTDSGNGTSGPERTKLSFSAAARIVTLSNKIRTTRAQSDSQTCAIS